MRSVARPGASFAPRGLARARPPAYGAVASCAAIVTPNAGLVHVPNRLGRPSLHDLAQQLEVVLHIRQRDGRHAVALDELRLALHDIRMALLETLPPRGVIVALLLDSQRVRERLCDCAHGGDR